MDLDGGVKREDFAFVRLEMGGREVAEVDGAGAVFGELMGGGAADSEGAVGACFGCVRGGRTSGGAWKGRGQLGHQSGIRKGEAYR